MPAIIIIGAMVTALPGTLGSTNPVRWEIVDLPATNEESKEVMSK